MAATKPCDMTLPELDAALRRLAAEHRKAGPVRREVVGRVCDAVLDEVNARKAKA